MAQRPVFVVESASRVSEVPVDFQWYPGMSKAQKQRSVNSLHEAANSLGLDPILEISTKSESPIGRSLSALNLEVSIPGLGKIPVECAFQGSKVFQDGGPFTDLYQTGAVAAKRDPRLRESGKLVRFELKGDAWPLEPKTAFYDWLYLQALVQNESLSSQILNYAGFTDIEFNPKKSINTQARSCALYVAQTKQGTNLEKLLGAKPNFLNVISQVYKRQSLEQPMLF